MTGRTTPTVVLAVVLVATALVGLADARSDLAVEQERRIAAEGDLADAHRELDERDTAHREDVRALDAEVDALRSERDSLAARVEDLEAAEAARIAEAEALHTVRGWVTVWPDQWTTFADPGVDGYECDIAYQYFSGQILRLEPEYVVNVRDGAGNLLSGGEVVGSHLREDGGCSMHYTVPDVPVVDVYTLHVPSLVVVGEEDAGVPFTRAEMEDRGWIAQFRVAPEGLPDGYDVDAEYAEALATLPPDQADAP